jgi:PmbA protein
MGGVQRGVMKRRLLNSRGLDASVQGTSFDMGVDALQISEQGFLNVAEGTSWRQLQPDLMKYARVVAKKMKSAQKIVPSVSGSLPVIFSAKAVYLLLSSFAVNSNGKNLQKNMSILKDKLGQKVLDERVTIWDDALADYAPGSMPFDGEGVPTQRLAIFEKGVFKNYVFDLQTAGIMGCQSTGSAMRSARGQPMPGHANLRMAAGTASGAEMLRGIKRGVLVDQVLGGGQSNVLAGEFSVNLDLGYLIENGEIVGRLKDTMIAGNVFDAFNNIRSIGRELEWHHSEELPPICFEALSVAGGKE